MEVTGVLFEWETKDLISFIFEPNSVCLSRQFQHLDAFCRKCASLQKKIKSF